MMLVRAQGRELAAEDAQGASRFPPLQQLEELLLPKPKSHQVPVRSWRQSKARSRCRAGAPDSFAAEQLLRPAPGTLQDCLPEGNNLRSLDPVAALLANYVCRRIVTQIVQRLYQNASDLLPAVVVVVLPLGHHRPPIRPRLVCCARPNLRSPAGAGSVRYHSRSSARRLSFVEFRQHAAAASAFVVRVGSGVGG